MNELFDRRRKLTRTARQPKHVPLNLPHDEMSTENESYSAFFRRGGTITKCEPNTAKGRSSSLAIPVAGETVPLSRLAGEYVPAFVRDLESYDAAQNDPLTDLDDGTTELWYEYEQASIPGAWRPDVRHFGEGE